jgi:hypothetical protein
VVLALSEKESRSVPEMDENNLSRGQRTYIDGHDARASVHSDYIFFVAMDTVCLGWMSIPVIAEICSGN